MKSWLPTSACAGCQREQGALLPRAATTDARLPPIASALCGNQGVGPVPDEGKLALAGPLLTLTIGILLIVIYANIMTDADGGGGANIGGGFLLLIGYAMTGLGALLTLIALLQRRR